MLLQYQTAIGVTITRSLAAVMNGEIPMVSDSMDDAVEHLDVDVAEYQRLGLTPQQPVRISGMGKSKLLHGRFLHITDIHPDELYVEGSDIDQACHHGKGKGDSKASKFGDAVKGCDTPMTLVNATLEWVRENLKDKIDFVIWTGDNIRHDNDRRNPRTEMHIFEMNALMADAFTDIFHGKALDPRDYDVHVIPSLGNNDVYPHNLFAPGPTLQTRELWNIWSGFIPQEQLHIFQRGSYFFQEVVPNKLAVLSINTLYLFKANPLVDSCDNKKDPGFKLFQWLGVTLQELRERNMKVWLSGHVPPIPKNYDITCYRKFVMWQYEYRDIIIGGVYGHMNLDHFIPVDAKKAYKSYHQSLIRQGSELDEDLMMLLEQEMDEDEGDDLEQQYLASGFNVSEHDLNVAIAARDARALGGAPANKEAYMDSIREIFYADVKSKKKSGLHSDRYAITSIAASVIPTFNPGFRVWEYNISGIENGLTLSQKPWNEFFADLEAQLAEDEDFEITGKKKRKGKKSKQKPDISVPEPMPEDAELGPAYAPQTFSPLRFVQYYLDLAAVNDGSKPLDFEVEYVSDGQPYNMKSLLVDDYLSLARKFGRPLNNKKKTKSVELDEDEDDVELQNEARLEELWQTYVKHVFVSSGYHD